jgi:hypothetical protein
MWWGRSFRGWILVRSGSWRTDSNNKNHGCIGILSKGDYISDQGSDLFLIGVLSVGVVAKWDSRG